MRDYLIFRLYGPMAAWGDIAVGEIRPVFLHPSKSAILGLIAAALGISRDQESLHLQLADCYAFAVQVNAIGVPLTDYHTIQVPPSKDGRKQLNFITRRDEITALPKEKLKTILSSRDYRMDTLVIVAVWVKASQPYPLDKLAEALQNPVYTLYLGRKSCPLALPLEAQVVSADNIENALLKAKFTDFKELRHLPATKEMALYWEEGGDSGRQPQNTFERRDVLISRRRWQFDVRWEHHASYPKED